MYRYSAYGLNIKSAISLIGKQFNGRGSTIQIIKCNLNKLFFGNGTEFEISDNLKLIRGFNKESVVWNDIEICRVLNDDKIIINSSNFLDENFVRIIILDIAIPILLIKKHMLMLHANAVNMGGNGVLFLGPTGIGKSTISIFLHKNGYNLLSDDISGIKLDKKNEPTIFSGFSTIKLWPEIINILGINTKKTPKVHQEVNKYLHDINESHCDSIPLKSIYILKKSHNTHIQDMPPQSAVIELINNTLFGKVLDDRESIDNLNHCVSTINNATVKILNVKHGLNDINDVVKTIEEDLFSL